MKFSTLLLAAALLSPALPARSADAPPAVSAAGVQPHVSVPHIAGPLKIDGDLSKPEWQQAGVIEDLVQVVPFTGVPTDFHTRVLLLRDDDHLYIAVHATDPDPRQVQTHTLQRDGSQDSDDHITLMLNTFDDHRSAYIFRINVGAARNDGVESNGVDNADFGWDGIWEAKTRRTPDGWDMEIGISTRSLQFPPDSSHWGFNIARFVPRNTLVTKWAAINPAYSAFSPQQYGILDGMTGLKSGSGFELNPYLLVRSDQIDPDSKRAQAGGEVKYSFTPQLAGTLTVNTDFAQTEADAQQINLSQFSLYFPEKRQFFLDGSSLFAYNAGAMNGYLNGGFTGFYSRDIGIAGGRTVPIDEGVKLADAGDLSMGVLDVDTGKITGVPAENLFVGRFAYDLAGGFRVGTLLTRGDPSGLADASFTGFDGAWQTDQFFGHKFQATAWGANTSGAPNPGLTRGYGYELTYPNYSWYADLQVNTFGDAFNVPLGFLPRPGTRQTWEEFGWFPTPAQPTSISFLQFDENYNQINDLAGHLQSYRFDPSVGSSYVDGSAIYIHRVREYEAVSTPFAIDNNVTIPVGAYAFDRWRVEYDSPLAPFRIIVRPIWGQFYSGTAQDDYVQATYAGFDGKLELGLTNESVFAHLAQGNFVQRLWQLSAAWSFSPDLSLTTFVQHDTSVDQLGFNTRLHWVIAADKDLYVVWNRNWRESVLALTPGTPDVADAVIVKLAWNFTD